MTAEELINLYKHELSKAMTFRTLYQNVADLMFPRENQITRIEHPGRDKNSEIADPTGQMSLIEMANGLSVNLFPPGQRFYNVVMSDKSLNEIDSVKRVLGQITEISHEKRTNSNFKLMADETLMSISGFGTGNLFSEWVPGIGLNYIDYDIGQYLIMENSSHRVDTMLLRFPFTARQAIEKWGFAGKSVSEAMEKIEKQNDIFWFIRIIQPREKRNPRLTDNQNMPWEVIDIAEKDKIIIGEGGFEEFPHFVTRWSKSSNEIWGRGRGTVALPAVRELQAVKKDLTECANKWNDPPREVLSTFEGEVQTYAKALNWVAETGSIKAIDEGVRGNFPITKDFLEMERDEVREIMLNDVFIQLRDLKGDRRNELEIRARLAEGLERLGPPVGRIQDEWLGPMVIRDIMLLFRNGQLPPLPSEMQGKPFKIEYIGRLALELNSQQAKGWLQWTSVGAELEGSFPGISDNNRIDSGYRRYGEALGVSVDDMSSEDEIKEKRRIRQEQLDAKLAMEAAQTVGQAYGQTTAAPEEGSAAELVMGGA